MSGFTQADASQIGATKNWGFALLILAATSAFFLALRIFGRAAIVPEFEVLVIHLPTIVCLIIYAGMTLSSRKVSS
jgi:hypothetical protein